MIHHLDTDHRRPVVALAPQPVEVERSALLRHRADDGALPLPDTVIQDRARATGGEQPLGYLPAERKTGDQQGDGREEEGQRLGFHVVRVGADADRLMPSRSASGETAPRQPLQSRLVGPLGDMESVSWRNAWGEPCPQADRLPARPGAGDPILSNRQEWP